MDGGMKIGFVAYGLGLGNRYGLKFRVSRVRPRVFRSPGSWGRCRPVLAQASVTDSYVIDRTDDYGALQDCASFFVDAFWVASTTDNVKEGLGGSSLKGDAHKQLVSKQEEDLSSRYGRLTGKRRLSTSFFIARGEQGILGCVGIEVAVVKELNGAYEVLPREVGERLFSSTLGAMSAPVRNSLRKSPLHEVAAIVFDAQEEEGKYSLHPVLSNLAVSPNARGLGLGKRLCEACEEEVRTWNEGLFKDIWLIVEDANGPAKKLYEEKLGYSLLWRDEDAYSVRILSSGMAIQVISVPGTQLLFCKDLQ
ncbi:hypothetical protein NDN08_007992 [Rhodosorus marinus]|uniref:N-acetyltransferase domain-containing protein n=1 Tax=Rhodosorus marinus TaxID=101924 RepID=A0AAV8UZG7_9RHOD|nr:hypothetical protein NDN08_007992 [Rhodosorus marinus]